MGRDSSSRAVSAGNTDVLAVLGPLTAGYVRRASPEVPSADRCAVVSPTLAPTPSFVRCRVEAVVTVDAERRLVWPQHLDIGRITCVGLRVIGSAIEIVVNGRPGVALRTIDQHGRLRLPRGVLSATGLCVGDQLVVARRVSDDGTLVLVHADRLVIDLLEA